jgi:hypothetical protein
VTAYTGKQQWKQGEQLGTHFKDIKEKLCCLFVPRLQVTAVEIQKTEGFRKNLRTRNDRHSKWIVGKRVLMI